MEDIIDNKTEKTSKKRKGIKSYKNLGLTPTQILNMAKEAEIELQILEIGKQLNYISSNTKKDEMKSFKNMLDDIELLLLPKINEIKENKKKTKIVENNEALV